MGCFETHAPACWAAPIRQYTQGQRGRWLAAAQSQPYVSCLWGRPWRLWRLPKTDRIGGRDSSGRSHTDLAGNGPVRGRQGRPTDRGRNSSGVACLSTYAGERRGLPDPTDASSGGVVFRGSPKKCRVISSDDSGDGPGQGRETADASCIKRVYMAARQGVVLAWAWPARREGRPAVAGQGVDECWRLVRQRAPLLRMPSSCTVGGRRCGSLHGRRSSS